MSVLLAAHVQVRPGCWQLVNPSKAILPRLWALLRHGCYGSAASSFPALLPLLALMPAAVVGPSPHVLEQLLGSCWTGLKACSARWGAGMAGWCTCQPALTCPASASGTCGCSMPVHAVGSLLLWCRCAPGTTEMLLPAC
jgi:hypothetical protein